MEKKIKVFSTATSFFNRIYGQREVAFIFDL